VCRSTKTTFNVYDSHRSQIQEPQPVTLRLYPVDIAKQKKGHALTELLIKLLVVLIAMVDCGHIRRYE